MSGLAWTLRIGGATAIVVALSLTHRLAAKADWAKEASSVTQDKYGTKPLKKSKRGAYDFIYLGAFGGMMQPYHGGAMNSHGDVCGAIQPEVKGIRVPFRISKRGTAQLLQVRGQNAPGRAAAINDRGQVVGVLDAGGAFLWEGNRVQMLPPPAGYATSDATSISQTGVVAGFAFTSSTAEYWRWKAIACVWRAGKPFPLPLPSGCVASRASGINSDGMVVGNAITKDGKTRAFLYDGKTSRLLPLLPGGTLCSGAAINSRGQVAGSCDHHPAANPEVPFDVHPVIWEDGKVRDLGLPKGYRYAKAISINDRGHVGITAQLLHWDMSDCDFYKGFVWSPGKGLVRLNTLVDPGFGHHISKVYALNNADEVLAQGRFLKRPWELIEPFYLLVPHGGR